LCHLSGCFVYPFHLVGDRGFFVDRSRRTVLFASIFGEQLIKSRVGFDQPTICALPLHLFSLPRVKADAFGHRWTVRLS
jgi:hypothetical protein